MATKRKDATGKGSDSVDYSNTRIIQIAHDITMLGKEQRKVQEDLETKKRSLRKIPQGESRARYFSTS